MSSWKELTYVFLSFQSSYPVFVDCDKQRKAADEEEVWSSVYPGYHSDLLQVNIIKTMIKTSMVLRFGHTTTINIYAVSLVICSVEKDGSPLSDEKKTIQTSLFALLKDFLKSPTQEELLSFLAFILTVGEEQQVIHISLISMCF